MALPLIQKPLPGVQVNWGSPFARDLAYALPLVERSGQGAFDIVSGRMAPFVGSPSWQRAGNNNAEPVVRVAAASSQYVNIPNSYLSWLDGASQFTVILCMSRTATSNYCEMQMGASVNQRIAIQQQTDGNCYFVVGNGQNGAGSFSGSGVTGRRVFALRYDGRNSTNATRLRGFLDGVEKTLSYAATIPATANTSGADMRLGQVEAATRYSNGDFYWLLIYRTALSPQRIKDISERPYLVFRQPGVPRIAAIIATPPHLLDPDFPGGGAGTFAPVIANQQIIAADFPGGGAGTFAPTVEPDGDATIAAGFPGATPGTFAPTISNAAGSCDVTNRDPAAGAEFIYHDDAIRWRWIPTNYLDPVREASITAEVNGVSYTPTTTPAIGGAFDVEVAIPLNDGMTYAVDTTADTVGTAGTPVELSWSFTTAAPRAGRVIARGFTGIIPASPVRARGATVSQIASYVRARGISIGTGTLQAGKVIAKGSVGVLVTLERAALVIAQGWITEYVTQWVVTAAVEVGELGRDFVAAAVELFNPAGFSAGVDAGIENMTDGVFPGPTAGVEVASFEQQQVSAAVEAGLRALEPGAVAGVEVDGFEVATMVVVDSPSIAYAAEDED